MLDDGSSTGLRERKKAALRESLYQTALTLFRETSYDDVTVSAICKAAGVAKGTFFNHFPTKDHILLEWFARMTHVPPAARVSSKSVHDRVLELSDAFFDICLADPDLWRAKRQRMSLNDDFRKAERESDAHTHEVLSEILCDGIERGEIDPRNDPSVNADLMLAILTGTVHDWTVNGAEFDVRSKVDERLRAFLTAIGTRD